MMRAIVVVLVSVLVLAQPAGAATFEARVKSPAGAAVEDAAVVLEPLSGAARRRTVKATIAQRDREFIPYLTIVQTGTAVDFPNNDPFKHHVYSFSPAKKFEIKLYAGKPQRPVVFDTPGEVAIGCNVHDWMEAYVLVVNTPYFAKTDPSGHAVVKDVPPGRYRIKLYHPRQKNAIAPREIEVGRSGGALAFDIDVAARPVKHKPPVEAAHY